ncbi:hypothetical protein KUH32_16720 [Thalassococcus sp. CAU 1522]|uniref:Uncharacterized protein n=1 Tax=Thalassococcus arenae TaxID=2851652 RepID=A0ABS6NCW2_9RHOB|nr:hypothetical protein [Thalassococcus arenae]MBV2361410.1 hypothetical protein [Thalassococcus arenae]
MSDYGNPNQQSHVHRGSGVSLGGVLTVLGVIILALVLIFAFGGGGGDTTAPAADGAAVETAPETTPAAPAAPAD